jgi:hypothetical protein
MHHPDGEANELDLPVNSHEHGPDAALEVPQKARIISILVCTSMRK